MGLIPLIDGQAREKEWHRRSNAVAEERKLVNQEKRSNSVNQNPNSAYLSHLWPRPDLHHSACRSEDRVNLLPCMPKSRDETVALGLSTRLAQSDVPGLISQGFSCLLQGHLQASCRGYWTPFPLPPPDWQTIGIRWKDRLAIAVGCVIFFLRATGNRWVQDAIELSEYIPAYSRPCSGSHPQSWCVPAAITCVRSCEK